MTALLLVNTFLVLMSRCFEDARGEQPGPERGRSSIRTSCNISFGTFKSYSWKAHTVAASRIEALLSKRSGSAQAPNGNCQKYSVDLFCVYRL
jgi:hypothetical protein